MHRGNVERSPPRNLLSSARDSGSPRSDFDGIRTSCLRKGVLYEDPEFPATDTSVYFSRHPPFALEWKRPREIAQNYGSRPELFLDGANRFDVVQGRLGDCWLLTATACMSENPELVYRTIPRGQGFHSGWYAGMFHFLFWRYGKWEEVIIDDRLPTSRGQLVFVHSRKPNEFWPALLEKAYAKLHGSYEAIKSGHIADAFMDLTGGVTESYTLRGKRQNVPKNVVNIMFKALERQSLIGCGIIGDGQSTETQLPNGLATAHAYSITDLREIRLISDRGEIPITLIRIRNPWGSRVEWNGPWSDRSLEWNSIPSQDRQAMGLIYRDDGEFWMDFKDFLDNFDTLDICNLTPDAPIETPRKWTVVTANGSWVPGLTAGGRPFLRDTHWINPQYKVSLKDVDDDSDDICSFVVQLMQKDKRRLRHKQLKLDYIGFLIYKCFKEFPLPLSKVYFDQHNFVERVDTFTNTRQVTKRFTLPPGDYIIVPCTFEAKKYSDFLLRIFFGSPNTLETADTGADEVDIPAPPSDPMGKNREEQFKKYFYDVSGEDMEVDAYEFRRILNKTLASDPAFRAAGISCLVTLDTNVFRRPDSSSADVSIDSCKSMILLVDKDNTGKLGFFEFMYLWDNIRSWRRIFQLHDKDKKGSINSFELRPAVFSLGYRVNTKVIKRLVFRFADEENRISEDSFISCIAKIMSLFNIYKSQESNGKAVFTRDQFLEKSLTT